MTISTTSLPMASTARAPAPLILAGLAFLVAFAEPMAMLVRDWWNDPDAGHGLLLFPISLWLAWKRGIVEERDPSPRLGLLLLGAALLLRFVAGLAAELFTMRFALVGALVALIVYFIGLRQVLRWWLPLSLLVLCIPLPTVLLNSLALPLQFKASQWGAALLETRNVPVRLAGNVIQLPGRTLFVTEACSGLRSLTALIALGLLIAGLWLRSPWSRAVLVLSALPVAVVLNAVRVFLTGFLAYYVDPALVEGFMHLTEGWVIFIIAFLILGATAWLISQLETQLRRRRVAAAPA